MINLVFTSVFNAAADVLCMKAILKPAQRGTFLSANQIVSYAIWLSSYIPCLFRRGSPTDELLLHTVRAEHSVANGSRSQHAFAACGPCSPGGPTRWAPTHAWRSKPTATRWSHSLLYLLPASGESDASFQKKIRVKGCYICLCVSDPKQCYSFTFY